MKLNTSAKTKNIIKICISCLIVMYIFLSVILLFQIYKRNKFLEQSITEKLDIITEKIENNDKKIEGLITESKSSEARLKAYIQASLISLQNNNKKYFTKSNTTTTVTDETVDQDVTKKLLYSETLLAEKETKGYQLMKNEKYAAASKIFTSIIDIDPNRFNVRYYNVYCKFYANPMNRDNYKSIMTEIKFLREKGFNDKALTEIENQILQENNLMRKKR